MVVSGECADTMDTCEDFALYSDCVREANVLLCTSAASSLKNMSVLVCRTTVRILCTTLVWSLYYKHAKKQSKYTAMNSSLPRNMKAGIMCSVGGALCAENGVDST